MDIKPVILCGGAGTRMWPLSRDSYPKQLLSLNGDKSLLQSTVLRLHNSTPDFSLNLLPPIFIGNDDYRFLLAEQLRQIDVTNGEILLEPCGRNTAPALTLGALLAQCRDSDPILLVMPADHLIQDESAFRESVSLAAPFANSGKLVTFGIFPTAPETGYGYIRTGDALAGSVCNVAEFVEKPDSETAQAYIDSGRYLWNSGIFMVKASVWLAKISQFRPDILSSCEAAFYAKQVDMDFIRPDKEAFFGCPADSIDYAVMEPLTAKGSNQGDVVIVPLNAGWSDLGAWNALWEIGAKDVDGNVFKGDVFSIDTMNSLVLTSGRLVAMVGMQDVVVVETPDAILVGDLNQIQKIKDVVGQLKSARRPETSSHRKVHRPWGWYDSIDIGSRFQVKRIVVNPGGVLSLQMHHHRAEHWIVVSGTARVTNGDNTFLVSENEFTYIPIGATHRLENPGKLPLEMIEVQSGSYLGEDDIVRFEDRYGR